MKTIRFVLLSCLMLLAAVNVQANDFLEIQDHYTVMAKGPGVLHFKVPVYSRGGYNYYVSSNSQGNSRFYYKKSSSDSAHTLFYIDADRADVNANDDISYGKVDVQAGTDEGIIEIANSQQHIAKKSAGGPKLQQIFVCFFLTYANFSLRILISPTDCTDK